MDEKPRIRPAADLSKLCQLLDDYPLSRSRSACEASQLIGRALSPHQLHVRDGAVHFEARHNQIHLGQLALNVLSYGSEVEIDPGERGDSYLLQLPLQGRARVRCNGQEAWVGPDTMSVLQPRAETRMIWGGDCAMIMLQVPSQMLRTDGDTGGPLPALNLTRSRHDPAVAAWWQAVIDLTRPAQPWRAVAAPPRRLRCHGSFFAERTRPVKTFQPRRRRRRQANSPG